MKTIIAAVISVAFLIGAPVFLMEKQQSVFAISPYQSGFQHGVNDGKDSCTHQDTPNGCHWYILEPGNGFKYHTSDFIRGYVTGFCSVDPNRSMAHIQANFDCKKGPSSATWLSEHSAAYKEGFSQGMKDGHHSIFHNEAKLIGGSADQERDFDIGYMDGWRSTCKEMGLTVGADSGCELSMDAGTP